MTQDQLTANLQAFGWMAIGGALALFAIAAVSRRLSDVK